MAAFLVVLGAAAIVLRHRKAIRRVRRLECELQRAAHTARLQERERRRQQLTYLDPVTGLANRRLLAQRFEELTDRERPAVAFALLLIDLDQFRVINDSLGHEAGDALLVEIARRLRRAVGDPDGVFRTGGAEFAALVVNFSSESTVEAVCSKILRDLFAMMQFNGFEMISSPSIGISRFPIDGITMSQLFKVAEVALDAANRQGRNTWCWGGALRQGRVEFA